MTAGSGQHIAHGLASEGASVRLGRVDQVAQASRGHRMQHPIGYRISRAQCEAAPQPGDRAAVLGAAAVLG